MTSEFELKGRKAEGHQINFCEQCSGLFCETCSEAVNDGLFCSAECERKWNQSGE